MLLLLLISCVGSYTNRAALSPKDGYAAMIDSLDRGDMNDFYTAVERSEDVNYVGSEGHVLSYAIASDVTITDEKRAIGDNISEKATKILIDLKGSKLNLNYQDVNGITPLMLAAIKRKSSVISTLISRGALKSLGTMRFIDQSSNSYGLNDSIDEGSIAYDFSTLGIEEPISLLLPEENDNSLLNNIKSSVQTIYSKLEELSDVTTAGNKLSELSVLLDQAVEDRYIGLIHKIENESDSTILSYALEIYIGAIDKSSEKVAVRAETLELILDKIKSEINNFYFNPPLHDFLAFGDLNLANKVLNSKYLNKKLKNSDGQSTLYRYAENDSLSSEIIDLVLNDSDIMEDLNSQTTESYLGGEFGLTALMALTSLAGSDENFNELYIDFIAGLMKAGANADLVSSLGDKAVDKINGAVLLGKELTVNEEVISSETSLSSFINNYNHYGQPEQ